MSRVGGAAMPTHRARPFNDKVLACPECRRRFARLRDLNIHLRRRHGADYAVSLPKSPGERAAPRARKDQKIQT